MRIREIFGKVGFCRGMNLRLSIFALSLAICVASVPAIALSETITLSTVISGTVNGEPIAASGSGAIDPFTGFPIDGTVDELGRLESILLFTQIPSNFPVLAYDKSWKCKHHKHKALAVNGGFNFVDIGAVDYDFTSILRYPNGDTIVATGSVRTPEPGHASLEMVLNGTYTGPINVTGALGTTDRISPDGVGRARCTGTEVIVLADGQTMVAAEETMVDFVDGSLDLPFEQFLDMDLLQYEFDEGTSELTIVTESTIYPVSSIPTLTEWGLIIFGVVLLGFITWVFLKRRKAVAVSAVEPS